jgi:hypothetical protein
MAIGLDLIEGFEAAVVERDVPLSVWLRHGLPIIWNHQHGPLAAIHALAFAVLGIGYVQARMTSALLGIATVWLLVRCGYWAGSLRWGVAAALLLAVAPWHVAFSRGNDAEHVLSTFHAVLTLVFSARAARLGRWGDWLLAGCALGASVYVYAPNQLVPAIAVILLASIAVSSRGLLSHDALRITAAGIMATFVAAPHLGVWLRSSSPVPIRSTISHSEFSDYSLARLDDLAPNVVEAGRQMFVSSDDQWFTSPYGMLGPTTAVLSVAGVLLSLAYLSRRHSRLVPIVSLSTLVIGLLPGVLSSWVFARRLVLAALGLEMVAAVGLVAVSGVLGRMIARRIVALGLAVVAVGIHTVLGIMIYVRSVEIPESLMSTVFPAIADVIAQEAPIDWVLVVMKDDQPMTAMEDSLRIGSAPAVRPFVKAGYRETDLWQVISYGQLVRALQRPPEHARAIRIVEPFARLDEVPALLLEALAGRAHHGPTFLVDHRGVKVARSWEVRGRERRLNGAETEVNVSDLQ